MKDGELIPWPQLNGDQLLAALSALANPLRLRILARLVGGRQYVSQLARDVGMSRPLLHMHLQRLEGAGLVTGHLELSADGKAMKYFEVAPFLIEIDPARLAAMVETLSIPDDTTPKGE
ncbi:MAG TPA: winged helix-turn-helix domain-containing protein [Tepidiformaceae bacterium]